MFRPIGIFDSGMGGISVLRDAVRLLPGEHYVFYGDNRFAPYGLRTKEEILACVRRVTDVLLRRDIKALVIACNTATAAAARELREELPIPVIGMEPALKPAHELRGNGQILVLATPATLHMEKFRHLMALYGEGAVPVEGSGIVENVESGHVTDGVMEACLRSLLEERLKVPTDAIVLGCTHYVFVRPLLEKLAPGVRLVDGNEGTVHQLERLLRAKNQLAPAGTAGRVELLTSGDEAVILPRMRDLLEMH